jgi:hypothetical protein
MLLMASDLASPSSALGTQTRRGVCSSAGKRMQMQCSVVGRGSRPTNAPQIKSCLSLRVYQLPFSQLPIIVFPLVVFLALVRTVLDASALVAIIFRFLDTLRADRALIVHSEGHFVCFAGSSVRGTRIAVNNKNFGTGLDDVRTSRTFCTHRCSTLRSCTRHTGDILSRLARHLRRSACTRLVLSVRPCRWRKVGWRR